MNSCILLQCIQSAGCDNLKEKHNITTIYFCYLECLWCNIPVGLCFPSLHWLRFYHLFYLLFHLQMEFIFNEANLIWLYSWVCVSLQLYNIWYWGMALCRSVWGLCVWERLIFQCLPETPPEKVLYKGFQPWLT